MAIESTNQKTLYLIDGHAQFFRAYHAIRSAMSSPVTKEPTNMTYGFVGMLLKILKQYKPDYLAVVIDAAGDRETFRSEIYPEYKATRKPTPEDLPLQIERCLGILRQMSVPVIAEPGVEADDAIATIVRRLQREQPDLRIRIVSRDKDLTQLLNHNVELVDVHKDTSVTAADVFGVEGVKPEHVIDILTLMGDTVDNVPGVPGVGPKTAAELILKYGSVANLLANLDEVKGKRRENIEAAKDVLALSAQLVRLKEDVPLEFDLEAARSDAKKLPVEELLATLREVGFNRYQDEVKALAGMTVEPEEKSDADGRTPKRGGSGATPQAAEAGGLFAPAEPLPSSEHVAGASTRGTYESVTTIKQLDALIKRIRKAKSMAIDTETTGLSFIDDALCGICIALEPMTGCYVPVRSPAPDAHMDEATVIAKLKPILEDESIRKIGHNLKFDINILRRAGVRLKGIEHDTMIASYVIDATRSSHGMDAISLAWLNHTCIPITDLIGGGGAGKQQHSFETVPLDRATEYAAEDADITLRLCEAMTPRLKALGLERLFHDLEMPLVDVLAELEWNGIRVDPDELDHQRAGLEKKASSLRKEIQEQAPHPFNPDSPKQLAAALFNKADDPLPGLGIKPLKRNKTGPSTDQEVLDKLAADPTIESPIPRLIVEYRQLTKLVNTYLVALKAAINPRTGRIHASFNQTVAVTGRLSSSDPNLQNIPIRTDVGREIRRAFVAETTQYNWLNGFEREATIPPSLEGGGQLVGEASLFGQVAVAETPVRTHPPAPPSPSLSGKGGKSIERDEPNVLITADYSQIELRLLAHLSDDAALIDAFHKGLDIHTAVAAEVFGVDADHVNPSQRNSAKMVNFGIVYGITAFGLARRLQMAGTNTTNEEAARIIADYKARYTGIATFLQACIDQAKDKGFVETILGRRRPIPEVHSKNPATRALGERYAINTVVQGSAADLIKLAMIDIQHALSDEPDARAPTDCNPWASATDRRNALGRTRMLVQIHDELVFESPRSVADEVMTFVRERMQSAMKLKVPLVVGAAMSENWIDAK